jgi:hypothetical protein
MEGDILDAIDGMSAEAKAEAARTLEAFELKVLCCCDWRTCGLLGLRAGGHSVEVSR